MQDFFSRNLWGKTKPSDAEIVGIIKLSDTEVVETSTFGT